MQRLRHPLRAIHEPFGKAGLTVAVIALVFAMLGGAFAAGGLTKSQEKQVTKIAKRYAGKPGAPGAPGTNGTNGTNGKDGAPGTPGQDGAPGPEGSPWTAGGTLPAGETENGTYSMLGGTGGATTGISFPIPLAAPLDEEHAIATGGLNFATNCPGTAEEPLAEPGYLCVYRVEGNTPFPINPTKASLEEGASTSGAALITGAAPGTLNYGTWAVTAPTP